MLKIEDTLAIVIVNSQLKEDFCFFLGEQNWIEKDWEGYVREFESKGIILVDSENSVVQRMLEKSYTIGRKIIYYFLGCNNLIKDVDIFSHYIFDTKTEWDIFLITHNNLYNAKFSDTRNFAGIP